jgi:hypothetical protein
VVSNMLNSSIHAQHGACSIHHATLSWVQVCPPRSPCSDSTWSNSDTGAFSCVLRRIHLSDALRHYRCSVVRFERCAARTGSSGIGQSTTKCARPAVVIERGQDCCFARRSAHSAALATGKGGECAVGAWGCDWRCEGSHAREIRHYPVECGRVLSQLGLGVPAPLDRPELELDRTSFGPGAWPESLQLKCICQLKRESSRVASARPVPISRHACCAPRP